MEVVILGAGGHGRDISHIAEAAGFDVVELLDDEVDGLSPLMTAWSKPQTVGYLLGFNRPEVRLRFDHLQRVSPAVVHPAAYLGPGCALAAGAVVAPGAILSNDVMLGRHAHVNAGATLVRARLGDFVTIAPGVHVGGDVRIGDGAFVGIGARIANLVTIGAWSTIGAGAVVLDDVAPHSVVVGAPAREVHA